MAIDPITATNLANYIPSIWSKLVLADMEKALVTGALQDRRYEQFVVGGGNTIVVPHLFNITPNVVNTLQDITLYDAVQNVTNISINKKYDIGVGVTDIEQWQTNPKYFDLVRTKIAYGLARQIDINTNVQFKSFSQKVGTVGAAITEDTILAAYEYLNLADAPYEGRYWAFDPETITDLMKIDMFVRMDYVPGAVWANGFQGRQILGAPVYITSNLDPYTSAQHAAAYAQREAVALVVQGQKTEVYRWPQRHSDVISALALFGVQIMRDSFGVCINTRS